jgi:tellurite methyltransferase
MKASSLIHPYLQTLALACDRAPALDLACGTGRNGLYLLARGIPVVFADRNSERLEQVSRQLEAKPFNRQKQQGRTWQVDFEVPGTRVLEAQSFGAILVFRYLHRPLLHDIKEAVIPGGLLIYETFTVEQPRFGRPRNPDFLLRSGELRDSFSKWKILHDFEGIERDTVSGEPRAIAQLVAEKPDNIALSRSGSYDQ